MSIHAVAYNLGADKDDQLGTGLLFVLMGKDIAQTLNLIKQGNPVSGIVLLFTDQSGQKDRLAGRYRNRALDLSFGDRRRQTRGSCRRNVADYLFDVEPDISIGVDGGRNTQNTPRVR